MNHPMEPPRLLLDDDADPIVRGLLQSGQREGPSKQAVLAAPAAIAALMATQSVTTAAAASATIAGAAASTTVATTAVAPMSSAAIAVLPILAKSIGMGLVVGGAMVATAVKVADPANHEPASIAAASATSFRESARVAAPVTVSVPSSAPAPEGLPQENLIVPEDPRAVIALPAPGTRSVPARVSAQPRSAPRSNDRPEISREIELIDAARRALGVGDPGRAIAQLDQHAALGRRLLEPEATVLRVRALLAQQRTTEAASVANGFIARQPSSPQAPVLLQLIAGDDMRDPK